MKRVKKLISSTLFIFSCLILASCNNTFINNSSVPEYEGMTISNGSPILNGKVNRRSIIENLNDTDSLEMTDVPEYDEHESEDDTLEEDIEDVVTIDIQTDDEVKYYVKPNETFIIEIHLSNPNQYEIQSFTLNGKKYSNYMFKDGSTMELLLLETTAPSTPGYFEYTIDAIKYIDGTDIKDVKMSGDKTIKTGIEYQGAPTAKITSQNVSTTYIDLGVNVSDKFSLIDSESLQIYLSDGENLIDKKTLKVGDNNITFSNLEAHTLYEYGVAATFDLVDGRDLHSEWLLKNTFVTQAIYSINNIQRTKTSISFDVNKNGEAGEIDNISLYDNSNGKLVASGNSSTRIFDNLLSNHTYRLYVDFSYYKNDIKIVDWVGEDITTIAKVEPEIVITDISSDKTSVSYKVNLNDVDGISSIDKVELLKNGSVVNSNNGLKEGTFTGLLSNNSYDIRVLYSYDLNDGNGIINSSVEKSITTIAKVEPEIVITNEQITDSFIGANLSFEDKDSVGILNSVELYKDEELISTNSSKEINFTGLDYYTDYKVVVNYSYDLNDGNGMVDAKYEINYKTSPYIEFKSCEIINTSAVSDGETIFMQANIDNPLGAKPKSVVVNGETYNCTGSTSTNRLYIEIANIGQFEGGDTLLTIEEVRMVIGGREYSIIPDSNNEDTIFINGSLTVESLAMVNKSGEKINYSFPDDDVYLELNLNNKTNYKIESVVVSGSIYSDILKINQNIYRVKVQLEKGWNDFVLNSITYANQYIEGKTIKTNLTSYNRVFKLNSSQIVEINNKTDLLNTEYDNYCYYKLNCDIDLLGYEWNNLGELHGVFDGSYHKISNMSNISTIKDSEIKIGLFSDVEGVVENLNIEKAKIIIDHQSTDPSLAYGADIGLITARSSWEGITIRNCNVEGDIQISNNFNQEEYYTYNIGGLIGVSYRPIVISNCDVNISINNRNETYLNNNYTASLVGRIFDGPIQMNNLNINCLISTFPNSEDGILFGIGYGEELTEIINVQIDLHLNDKHLKQNVNYEGKSGDFSIK